MSGDNSLSVGHIQRHGAGVQGHKLGSLPSRMWFRGGVWQLGEQGFLKKQVGVNEAPGSCISPPLFYFPAKWCWENAHVCYQCLVVSLEVSFFRAENLF